MGQSECRGSCLGTLDTSAAAGNIVDMAILTINIIIIALVMMLKIAKCGQCSI